MSQKFLDKVYNARTAEETRDVYDAWAKSYDAEVGENGYVTPGRCADALMQVMGDGTQPILDFGCGTGLSGLALRRAGFQLIDGVDLSPEMLAVAREKGIYRSLDTVEAGDPLPVPDTPYRAISAIGVIGAGAAPVDTIDLLADALAQGSFLVFSFNDHTLADPAYLGKLNEYLDCAALHLRFQEHGPHLPGRDMNSTVYVVEKA